MYGWQVKLYDPLVTHGPDLGALERKGLYIKRYINCSVYFTFTLHFSLFVYTVKADCNDYRLFKITIRQYSSSIMVSIDVESLSRYPSFHSDASRIEWIADLQLAAEPLRRRSRTAPEQQ